MKRNVGLKKKLCAAGLLLFITIGLSTGLVQNLNPVEYYYGSTAFKYTNNEQESVEGTGYVMENSKVNTNNLSLHEYMHGSGTFKEADVLNSQQKTSGSTVLGGDIYYIIDSYGKVKQYDSGASSVISYTKQNQMTQAIMGFSYGTGWYASHPVIYNSLLKDKTDAKSYQEGNEMEHQMEYARAYIGDIAVDLNCTAPTELASGYGMTHMKINDDMNEGTIHVSMLQSRPIIDTAAKPYSIETQGLHNPLILEDKSWVGSFKIQKDMKLEFTKSRYTSAADWLPCTCGGFFDIQDYDKLMPTAGALFDSTARNVSISTFRPAWNGTVAQFPESIYGKKP